MFSRSVAAWADTVIAVRPSIVAMETWVAVLVGASSPTRPTKEPPSA